MICCYIGYKKEFIYVFVVSVNFCLLNVNYVYMDIDVFEICIL